MNRGVRVLQLCLRRCCWPLTSCAKPQPLLWAGRISEHLDILCMILLFGDILYMFDLKKKGNSKGWRSLVLGFHFRKMTHSQKRFLILGHGNMALCNHTPSPSIHFLMARLSRPHYAQDLCACVAVKPIALNMWNSRTATGRTGEWLPSRQHSLRLRSKVSTYLNWQSLVTDLCELTSLILFGFSWLSSSLLQL